MYPGNTYCMIIHCILYLCSSNAPSELWVRKMKALFKCFDSDQNGLIEIEDWKRQVEKMKSHGNLEGE